MVDDVEMLDVRKSHDRTSFGDRPSNPSRHRDEVHVIEVEHYAMEHDATIEWDDGVTAKIKVDSGDGLTIRVSGVEKDVDPFVLFWRRFYAIVDRASLRETGTLRHSHSYDLEYESEDD